MKSLDIGSWVLRIATVELENGFCLIAPGAVVPQFH